MSSLEAWLTRVDDEHGNLEIRFERSDQRLTLSLGLWRGPLSLLGPGVEVTCELTESASTDDLVRAESIKTLSPLRRDGRFARAVSGQLVCQGAGFSATPSASEVAELETAPGVGQRVSFVRRRHPRSQSEFLAVALRVQADGPSAVPDELEGVLLKWNPERGFGIVAVSGRGTYLLPAVELVRDELPMRGERIRFEPRERPGGRGPSAHRARIVKADPNEAPPRPSALPPKRDWVQVDPSVRVQGTITSWVQHDDKTYGILREANSWNTLTFVRSSLRPDSAAPGVGRRVEFSHGYHPRTPGVLVATDVVVFDGDDERAAAWAEPPTVAGASTRRGPGHALNEDAFLLLRLERECLLAVADGTSQPVDTGWWSSDTALDLLWQLVKGAGSEEFGAELRSDRAAALERLLRNVQDRFLEQRGRKGSKFRSACTTLAVAIIGEDGWLHAASAGDSRVLVEDPASQAFRDVEWQGGSAVEPRGGQLTSAIGYSVLELRTAALRLAPGRTVGLATDGVSLARTHACAGVYHLVQDAENLQAAAEAATLESVRTGNDDATLLLFKYAGTAPVRKD